MDRGKALLGRWLLVPLALSSGPVVGESPSEHEQRDPPQQGCAVQEGTECLADRIGLAFCRESGESETVCREHADLFVHACVDEGRDETSCRRQASELELACLTRCEAPPPACGERCIRRSARLVEECRARGRTVSGCEARAAEATAECQAECARRMSRCLAACETGAEDAIDSCIENGGSEEECTPRAQQVLDRCVDHCNRPGAEASGSGTLSLWLDAVF